ncbi:MAG: hypothetical protein MUC50_22085 [Myxococcota bacterium]|jgi:hypothetical protein|nr:hypothetical protein [Myxococcota bacterium]
MMHCPFLSSSNLRRAQVCVFLSVFLVGHLAWAQQQPAGSPPEPKPEAASPQDAQSSSLDEQVAAIAQRLDQTANEAALQKAENEKLKNQVEELSSRLEMVESENEAEFSAVNDVGFERKFDIYGFMDVELYYFKIPEENTGHGLFPSHSSFMVNRFNLYFSSQMTETLSALAEVRFTFLPQGYEASYGIPAMGSEYERIDTTVLDPFMMEKFKTGGLSIERIYVQWKPLGWLGILAGHFFTPYGIWNVDHGSSVLIPVRPPFATTFQVLPSTQTGIQLFGRVFPVDRLYLDYAITLSNGRGPTEAIYDLDENKALGFRLKGVYEAENWGLSLGGYLFWGESTDVYKEMTKFKPPQIDVVKKESFTELTGSLDLLFQLYGLTVQGEFMRGKVQYSARPLFEYPFLDVENPFSQYQADHVKWCVYGLLAYRFDLKTPWGDMGITPFFMYEHNIFDDTVYDMKIIEYRGGLNIRPSPFVSLKYEVEYVDFPTSKNFTSGFWVHAGQVAVSF